MDIKAMFYGTNYGCKAAFSAEILIQCTIIIKLQEHNVTPTTSKYPKGSMRSPNSGDYLSPYWIGICLLHMTGIVKTPKQTFESSGTKIARTAVTANNNCFIGRWLAIVDDETSVFRPTDVERLFTFSSSVPEEDGW